MDQPNDRRLAAVLALDVVGYSHLMSTQETRTLDRLLRRRKSIFDALVAARRGRVIKGTGDGILAEFASARDALNAAIAIQKALAQANEREPNEPPMLARIGINTGDIIFADDDIYGDGVNIAARLESNAPTSGICVSGNVIEEVRRLGVAYRDAGELELKNIAVPVRAYHIPAEAILAVEDEQIAADAQPVTGRIGRNGTAEGPLRRTLRQGWARITLAVLVVAVAVLLATMWLGRSPPAGKSGMTVRLTDFKLLSADLPPNIQDTIKAEITAAFNADGAVNISTASAAAPGEGPAFSLGGTIQRDGQSLRVITNLTNERTGATVWGNTFNYDGADLAKVPRHIAVDAGNAVRCGLFGSSTYAEPLPDDVLRDYMQFCQWHWNPNMSDGRKALVPAQRVVQALPDFSWGWAAVAGGYWKVAGSATDRASAEEARAKGREAADRAVELDPKNSEALYIKAMLVDRNDWIVREDLLTRAVNARRLDCGCEYHQYGWMLLNVGRVGDAVERLRQADDMLALYIYTSLNLADGLVAAGRLEEAKEAFDASIDLAPTSGFANRIRLMKAAATSDLAGLSDPGLEVEPQLRSALLQGFRAVQSGNAGTKDAAVRALLALPVGEQDEVVARLLAKLGAAHDAFLIGDRLATRTYPGPSVFWYPDMRPTLDDPGFPALAERLGLMGYWKKTKTRPDVCAAQAAPAFCKAI